jgi:hypothetical protein
MPTPFGDIASMAVRTLRDIYAIPSPSDLVYRRFARGGHDFAEPGLGISSDRPTTPRGAGQQDSPTTEELRPLIEGALRWNRRTQLNGLRRGVGRPSLRAPG